MKQEFVSYEQALKLKELGFDEPCLAWYNVNGILLSSIEIGYNDTDDYYLQEVMNNKEVSAPLKQQVFRWFREQKILGQVAPIDDWNTWGFSITMEDAVSPFFMAHNSMYTEYITYEEAESACIDKLIEMIL